MYQNKKLRTGHHEIIRRAFLGQKNNQIAAEMALSPVTISIILNNPLAKMELARMQQEAEEKVVDTPARIRLGKEMTELQNEAAKFQLSAMKDPTLDLKVRASIARQHVEGGVYKTTEEIDNKISFKDLMRALVIHESAQVSNGDTPRIINVTPPKELGQ